MSSKIKQDGGKPEPEPRFPTTPPPTVPTHETGDSLSLMKGQEIEVFWTNLNPNPNH